MLRKFVSAILAEIVSAVKLSSGVVIYLSWSWSVIFYFNFTNCCFIVSFSTKFLTLGVLFSTTARAVVLVAKLVILGISSLTSSFLSIKSCFSG